MKSQTQEHQSVVNMPIGFRLLLSMFQPAALRLNSPLLLLAFLPWPMWYDPWGPLNVWHSSVAHVWNPLSMTPFRALDLPLLRCLNFLLLVKHPQ